MPDTDYSSAFAAHGSALQDIEQIEVARDAESRLNARVGPGTFEELGEIFKFHTGASSQPIVDTVTGLGDHFSVAPRLAESQAGNAPARFDAGSSSMSFGAPAELASQSPSPMTQVRAAQKVPSQNTGVEGRPRVQDYTFEEAVSQPQFRGAVLIHSLSELFLRKNCLAVNNTSIIEDFRGRSPT